jgi:tRNA A-37 threonylcarbamoyl transferase component Bud32
LSSSPEIANENRLPAPSSASEGVFSIAHKNLFESKIIAGLKIILPLTLLATAFVAYTSLRFLTGGHLGAFGSVCFLSALTLMTAYVVLLWVSQIKRDFILRQYSITLPSIYFLAAGRRFTWSWDSLTKVSFSRSGEAVAKADQIVLTFEDEYSRKTYDIHIKLKEIDPLDLKKLIYAIVTNAPQTEFIPPLDQVALEFPTVTGIKHINFHDFTTLWDEEFSTRYSPTLFVPLPSGTHLRNGAITISELVACGGSAAIYASQDSKGVRIIVKEAVIPKNTPEALKTKAIELFQRETLLLTKLNHPNIAKVLDHFVENEHHYEVIEYIDGLDLRRFVKERGPQPEEFVLNWAEQICEILVYLHSQAPPIIHRDLTPDNLVLRVDGGLVLIDFGAANAFVGTATGTMVGKQSYMPPEQIRGKSVPQSDIYSLGCTCYFLLTGKDPTPLEASQVDPSLGLSQSLNPFLAKCTAPELANRYKTALVVLEEIRVLRRQRQAEALQS